MIAEQVGQNQDLTDDDVQAISRMGTAVITQGLGKDTAVADQAAENAVENNYLTVREQINYANEMTECGKDRHGCKNRVREKYQAIYNKNQQAKIAELNKELSKPAFLRTMPTQEIKSAINLINNRPFKEEITKIPEQNPYGVEVISDERYVSRVELQTKEDLKDVAKTGVNFIPVVRTINIGTTVLEGAIEDYNSGNINNTTNNVIDRVIPKSIEKITKIRKEITTPVIEVIKLGDELNNE